MNDTGGANKAIAVLEREHEKPFFLAYGSFNPHMPWYVPQKYFDMNPLDQIVLPELKEAEGITEPDGFVNPTIPGSTHHGVNYGLYRVQLTGRGLHGQPLPPKYNTETTLGVGIGPFEN